MEQAHAGEGHDHTLLVALFNDQIVTDGAAGLCDVLNTGGKCTLNVITEGEECVTTQRHVATGSQPCLLVADRQTLRLLGKVVLPNTLGTDILFVTVDVAVYYIITVGTTQISTELKA